MKYSNYLTVWLFPSLHTVPSINESSRCNTYKYFKSLLNPETYLNMDLSFQLRKALARFRCCSHKHNIELGRHHNINREDRICFYCLLTKDVIILEDEYHAFYMCPRFEEERNKFPFNWYTGNREREGFYFLLKTNNVVTLKKSSYFRFKNYENGRQSKHCRKS